MFSKSICTVKLIKYENSYSVTFYDWCSLTVLSFNAMRRVALSTLNFVPCMMIKMSERTQYLLRGTFKGATTVSLLHSLTASSLLSSEGCGSFCADDSRLLYIDICGTAFQN